VSANGIDWVRASTDPQTARTRGDNLFLSSISSRGNAIPGKTVTGSYCLSGTTRATKQKTREEWDFRAVHSWSLPISSHDPTQAPHVGGSQCRRTNGFNAGTKNGFFYVLRTGRPAKLIFREDVHFFIPINYWASGIEPEVKSAGRLRTPGFTI